MTVAFTHSSFAGGVGVMVGVAVGVGVTVRVGVAGTGAVADQFLVPVSQPPLMNLRVPDAVPTVGKEPVSVVPPPEKLNV
jgi:hypothetical protein